MPRRLFAAVASLLLAAVVGVGAWQVVKTRSQLSSVKRQLASSRAMLSKSKIEERATRSALTSSRKEMDQYLSTTTTTLPCNYEYATSTSQYGCFPTPVLTDSAVLYQALATAAAQLTGSSSLPAGQAQEFVVQFDAAQEQQERLGAEGKAWSILSPEAQAGDFVEANDSADIIAANAAQWGDYLNCIVNSFGNTSSC